MKKIICMSFDGEYQTEHPTFETTKDAWEYSASLGSKWYFYPFHFVVSESGKTIIDAPELLSWAIGRRTKTVRRLFAEHSAKPECQNSP